MEVARRPKGAAEEIFGLQQRPPCGLARLRDRAATTDLLIDGCINQCREIVAGMEEQ